MQFPNDAGNENGWLAAPNPTRLLESEAPATVRQHILFKTLGRHFDRLVRAANEALAAAANRTLDPERFRSLAIEVRRLDSALDRFDVAMIASLTDVDELTGLLNRAAMERDLGRELAHARRSLVQ